MAKGNHTGKGGFKKGQSGNPSGMRKGMKERYNSIREFLLDCIEDNKAEIKKWAKANPGELVKEAIKILPKEVDVEANINGRFILVCDDDTIIERSGDVEDTKSESTG